MVTSEIPITDTYKDIERMIYQICHKFCSQYNESLEDLVGEANLAFSRSYKKYDSSRGQFTTFIHWCIVNHLIQYTNRNKKRAKVWMQGLDDDVHPIFKFATANDLDLKDFTDEMSADAKEVINLVFEGPQEIGYLIFRIGESKMNWRKALRTYLKNSGWSYRRVLKAFKEIREAL